MLRGYAVSRPAVDATGGESFNRAWPCARSEEAAHEMRPIAFTLRATQETGAGTVGGR